MTTGKTTKKTSTQPVSCDACDAACCRYVATQIDTPTCKRDYDNIRWYLLHNAVNVFIDHDDAWYLEFETDCSRLDAQGRCTTYEQRPRLCARHGEDGTDCEFHGASAPYKRIFRTAAEFEAYLSRKGIAWRWRR